MEDSGSMMELLVKNRRKKSKGNTIPDREILEGKIFFHREKVEGKIFPREGKRYSPKGE